MTNIPSQIWLGSAQILKKEAVRFLQNNFCKNTSEQIACFKCNTCLQIETEQFYNVCWLLPQGSYKIEQIREVILRMSLRLAQNEQFYFIFQDAHCLNDASANSLLKSIEEPPVGYNFLFLAPRKELLLATILSRSLIKNFASKDNLIDNEIYLSFTSKRLNPVEFNLLLDKQKDLTDQGSRELLDKIYSYWLGLAKSEKDLVKVMQINQVLITLQQAQIYPPMSGSSKLFWRNLYMQLSF